MVRVEGFVFEAAEKCFGSCVVIAVASRSSFGGCFKEGQGLTTYLDSTLALHHSKKRKSEYSAVQEVHAADDSR